MRRRLLKDLARWEAGDTTAAQLAGAHHQADVAGLTGLHARLARLAAEPSPDAEPGWAALRARLPERPTSTSFGWRARRAMVAAIAAALLASTSIAYAAGVEQVRGGVDAVAAGIRTLFGGSPNDTSPPAGDDDDLEDAGSDGQETDTLELGDPQTVEREEDDDGDEDASDEGKGDQDRDEPDEDEPDDDEPDEDEPDQDEPDEDEPDQDEPDDDEPDQDEPDDDEPDEDEPDEE